MCKIDRFKIKPEGFSDIDYIICEDGQWCSSDEVDELENKVIKLEAEKAELIERLYTINNVLMNIDFVNLNERLSQIGETTKLLSKHNKK